MNRHYRGINKSPERQNKNMEIKFSSDEAKKINEKITKLSKDFIKTDFSNEELIIKTDNNRSDIHNSQKYNFSFKNYVDTEKIKGKNIFKKGVNNKNDYYCSQDFYRSTSNKNLKESNSSPIKGIIKGRASSSIFYRKFICKI